MKIVIIGGGPGGLYFALLMKKRFPDHDITVYERNRADDTFGFGVVFSDETLDNLMDVRRGVIRRRSPASSPTGTRSTSIFTARSSARADTASAAPSAARCLRCCRRAAAISASSSSFEARSAISINSRTPT